MLSPRPLRRPPPRCGSIDPSGRTAKERHRPGRWPPTPRHRRDDREIFGVGHPFAHSSTPSRPAAVRWARRNAPPAAAASHRWIATSCACRRRTHSMSCSPPAQLHSRVWGSACSSTSTRPPRPTRNPATRSSSGGWRLGRSPTSCRDRSGPAAIWVQNHCTPVRCQTRSPSDHSGQEGTRVSDRRDRRPRRTRRSRAGSRRRSRRGPCPYTRSSSTSATVLRIPVTNGTSTFV